LWRFGLYQRLIPFLGYVYIITKPAIGSVAKRASRSKGDAMMEPGYLVFGAIAGIAVIAATLFAAYTVLFDQDVELEDYDD
jgi:hypothetical protein